MKIKCSQCKIIKNEKAFKAKKKRAHDVFGVPNYPICSKCMKLERYK